MRLIGTAGHVDHGKSTLVQALTGIHPSRLPEEQRRGMTLDLGYAYLDHPGGFRLGIVDVPGHERLVRNMVAGATGFSLALWAVDAREGVMPQSLEHLQILDLLGVRAVVPVITKADAAHPDQVSATAEAASALLAAAEVSVRPMHVVDSVTGRGIEGLRDALFAACAGEAESGEGVPPYLPVDRVFDRRGVGAVLTGTLLRGRVAEGDRLAVWPGGESYRVRSIAQHHAAVEAAGPGQRVGLHLSGLDAGRVRRGDTLVAPGHPYGGRFLNVRLRVLEGVPFRWKHGLRLLFHAGCAETECRLWGLVESGGHAWAQVELRREGCFYPGQRFILRNTSPRATVAGGEVLDLVPDRPRRVTPAELAAYAGRPARAGVAAYLDAAPAPLLRDVPALARRWMVPQAQLHGEAADAPDLCLGGGEPPVLVWHRELESRACALLRDLLREAEGTRRLVLYSSLARRLEVGGAPLATLLASVFTLAGPGVQALRDAVHLEKNGVVLNPGGTQFTGAERTLAEEILAQLHREGLRPSRVREYRARWGGQGADVDGILRKLRSSGEVVAVSRDFVLHPDAMQPLLHLLESPALRAGVRASDFGQALGISRKYSIPLLEYLNREGLLRRAGDLHFSAAPGPGPQRGTGDARKREGHGESFSAPSAPPGSTRSF
jgi:selenocysteine-specific elongation factor